MDAETFSQVLTTVRDLVRNEVRSREEEIEETDAVPDEVRRLAVEMGLFGCTLPEEYGGLGLNLYEDVQLAFEFGRTAPAFRSMFGTNNGIAGQVLARFGTDAQKEEYLPNWQRAPWLPSH